MIGYKDFASIQAIDAYFGQTAAQIVSIETLIRNGVPYAYRVWFRRSL